MACASMSCARSSVHHYCTGRVTNGRRSSGEVMVRVEGTGDVARMSGWLAGGEGVGGRGMEIEVCGCEF